MGSPRTERNSPYSKARSILSQNYRTPDDWEVRDRKGYGITANRRRRSELSAAPKEMPRDVCLLTKPVAPYFSGLSESMRHCHSLLRCLPPSGKQVLSPGLALFHSYRAHRPSADPPRSQAVSAGQRRSLSIHEYQSVNLLNSVCAPPPPLPIVLLLL
jgi:hypothetical protein